MPKLRIKRDQSFDQNQLGDQIQQKQYNFIPFDLRLQLISLVFTEKNNIKDAASKLDINLSTARYIIRCYKQKGRIMKKGFKDCQNQINIEKNIQSKKSSRTQKTQYEQIQMRKQNIKGTKIQKNKKESQQEKIDQKSQLYCFSTSNKEKPINQISNQISKLPITEINQNNKIEKKNNGDNCFIIPAVYFYYPYQSSGQFYSYFF